jgi:hypothetical protein
MTLAMQTHDQPIAGSIGALGNLSGRAAMNARRIAEMRTIGQKRSTREQDGNGFRGQSSSQRRDTTDQRDPYFASRPSSDSAHPARRPS